MRAGLTTAAEVLGAAVMVAGVSMLSVPAALIVGGLALVGLGALEGRP